MDVKDSEATRAWSGSETKFAPELRRDLRDPGANSVLDPGQVMFASSRVFQAP